MAKETYSDRRNIFGESEDYQGKDRSFDREIERYGVMAEFYKDNPWCFSEKNKKILEEVFMRVFYILKKDIPAETEKTCLKIKNCFVNKLDFNEK